VGLHGQWWYLAKVIELRRQRDEARLHRRGFQVTGDGGGHTGEVRRRGAVGALEEEAACIRGLEELDELYVDCGHTRERRAVNVSCRRCSRLDSARRGAAWLE